MDWLTNNPIANMPGPQFLVFYALWILGTYVVCRVTLGQRDPSRALPPLMVPTDPDPYEIAYLRGGENEVARAATFSLLQRGYLRTTSSAAFTGKAGEEWLERAPKAPDTRHLSPIERCLWDFFKTPSSAHSIFEGGTLPAEIKAQCAPYEQRLQAEQLLASPDWGAAAVRIGLIGALVIAGLGTYKLLVALSRGRTNVEFLVIMGLGALLVLGLVLRVPRLSHRGQTYLKQLRLAFEQARQRLNTFSTATADPLLPLLVGVFGVGVLASTPFDYYSQMFHKSASSSSSGSCGGGCGSCGGGSSGDGGGGCGGCGGGGGD